MNEKAKQWLVDATVCFCATEHDGESMSTSQEEYFGLQSTFQIMHLSQKLKLDEKNI
jgi:hypothetical protein